MAIALKVRSYSDVLNNLCALIGLPVARLSTEIAESLRVAFNSGYWRVAQFYDWVEICPYGEARFVGNKLDYPNNLAITSAWTATAMTPTGNSIANPLDGRITASKLLETTANSAHSEAHTAVAIVPSTTYYYSAYVRPNGRNWVYLKVDDGDLVHSCFYNVTTGVLGTELNCTGQIQSVGSGFYLCSFSFTTSTSITATTSAITVQTSTDGSTLSYAGTATLGLYVWGVLLQQTTNTGLRDALVAYDQAGETEIDTVFQCWRDSPFNAGTPRAQGYILSQLGIQVITGTVVYYAVVNSAGVSVTTQQSNPVFLYYRMRQPDFSGDTYVSADSYAVGDQVYFTDSDSVANYYKCIAAASAADTPESDPDKWELLEIPDSIFWAAVYRAYGDWLTSDGQADKGQQAYQIAETKMLDEVERQSRQQSRDFPMRVQTHSNSTQTAY